VSARVRVHRSQRFFRLKVVSVSDTFVHDGEAANQVCYTIDDRGSCVVVTVGGRVDTENCAGVCDAVQVAASSYSPGLVVDLARAVFAHAEAAGLVARSLQQSHRAGSSVCVVDPPEPVGWLLRVNEQTADIPIRADLTEAIAVLARDQHTPPTPLPATL
jgi:anti-anti-sigma regulatory factor